RTVALVQLDPEGHTFNSVERLGAHGRAEGEQLRLDRPEEGFRASFVHRARRNEDSEPREVARPVRRGRRPPRRRAARDERHIEEARDRGASVHRPTITTATDTARRGRWKNSTTPLTSRLIAAVPLSPSPAGGFHARVRPFL